MGFAVLILALVIFGDAVQESDNWPGFRGDGRSMSECESLPVHWDGDKNIAWRLRLPGYGQSSPVVWRGKVFITSVEGDAKETNVAVCIDAKTGNEVWMKRFIASQLGKNNPSVSRAAPTPVVDDDGVMVFFESGDLLGLTHDGRTLWERHFAREFGEIKNHHGVASSLAQTDRNAIVLLEHGGDSFLLAIDKKSGESRWKVQRPSGLSWSSPLVATFGGRECVVLSSNGSAAIHDTETGKELWKLAGLAGNLIPSATVSGDVLVIAAGEGGLTFNADAAKQSNRAFKVLASEKELQCQGLWEGTHFLAHHASPVICGEQVYFLTKAGILYCLDLTSGKELFTQRLESPCWATPIVARDSIYFFGKDGTTTVIKGGREFEKLALNRLWDESSLAKRRESSRALRENQFPALPQQGKAQMEAMLEDAIGDVVYGVAAADNSFYLRTGSELFCIRETTSR